MQCHHGLHRALGVVRCQLRVVRPGNACYLQRAPYSANSQRLWIDDVRNIRREEPREVVQLMHPLARDHTHRNTPRNLYQRIYIIRQHRSLEPCDIVLLQPIANLNRRADSEPVMRLDHYLNVIPYCLTHRREDGLRLARLLLGE